MQSLSCASVKPFGGVCPDAGSSFRPIHASSAVLAAETVVGEGGARPAGGVVDGLEGSPIVAAPETAMAWAEDHRPPLQENP